MTTVDIIGVLLGLALCALVPLFVIQLVKWSHDRMADATDMALYQHNRWLDDIDFWRAEMHSTNPARARLGAQVVPVLYANPPEGSWR